jgi:hypothetical protein
VKQKIAVETPAHSNVTRAHENPTALTKTPRRSRKKTHGAHKNTKALTQENPRHSSRNPTALTKPHGEHPKTLQHSPKPHGAPKEPTFGQKTRCARVKLQKTPLQKKELLSSPHKEQLHALTNNSNTRTQQSTNTRTQQNNNTRTHKQNTYNT